MRKSGHIIFILAEFTFQIFLTEKKTGPSLKILKTMVKIYFVLNYLNLVCLK